MNEALIIVSIVAILALIGNVIAALFSKYNDKNLYLALFLLVCCFPLFAAWVFWKLFMNRSEYD